MINNQADLSSVTIIATGGTIASRPDSVTGALTTSLTVDDLVRAVPTLENLAIIKTKQFSNIPSWSIDVRDMFRLWKAVKKEFDSGMESVVITHGTDTLEETAYFLDHCHDGMQTLVVTGAMRDASEVGADGPRNVLQSVRVSINPDSRNKGVLVVINDEIFSGSEVKKCHTWQSAAFSSANGPIGEIISGNVRFRNKISIKPYRFNGHIESVDFNVPIFKAWSGVESRQFFEAWKSLKLDGLVIEGTGAGNINPALLEPMKDLSQQNIPIVITTRVPEGGAIPVYGGKGGGKELAENGYIIAQNLSAAKARLKLIALLGSGIKTRELHSYF